MMMPVFILRYLEVLEPEIGTGRNTWWKLGNFHSGGAWHCAEEWILRTKFCTTAAQLPKVLCRELALV